MSIQDKLIKDQKEFNKGIKALELIEKLENILETDFFKSVDLVDNNLRETKDLIESKVGRLIYTSKKKIKL